MYFLALYFLIVVGVSLALEDLAGSDLSVFTNDLPDSSALGFDPNSDLFASNEALEDELSIPATNNLDLDWISQPDEEESNPSLFAANDCSSNDNGLGKRDGKGSCSINNQFKSPKFPTLDQFMNNIVPDNSEKQHEEPAEQPIWINEDDRRCLSDQPFLLCCLCELEFLLQVCQDCLPSKAFRPSYVDLQLKFGFSIARGGVFFFEKEQL